MNNIQKIADEIKKCERCHLHKTRKNVVPGEGPANAKLMFIGEAPGRQEDEAGRPFVGRAGKFLDKVISHAGITREKVFITSVLKCYPDGKPTNEQICACKGWLLSQVRAIKPEIIALLGNVALKNVLDKRLNISEVHGKIIKKKINGNTIFYFPTYHPAAAMRFPKVATKMRKDFEKLARFSAVDK